MNEPQTTSATSERLKDGPPCKIIFYVDEDDETVITSHAPGASARVRGAVVTKLINLARARDLDHGLWLGVTSAFGTRFMQLNSAQLANLNAGVPWGEDDAPA